MRLIDAEALIKQLQKENAASIPVISAIGKTPTVDAVKHGKNAGGDNERKLFCYSKNESVVL